MRNTKVASPTPIRSPPRVAAIRRKTGAYPTSSNQSQSV